MSRVASASKTLHKTPAGQPWPVLVLRISGPHEGPDCLDTLTADDIREIPCERAELAGQVIRAEQPIAALIHFGRRITEAGRQAVMKLAEVAPRLRLIALVEADALASPALADLVRKGMVYDFHTLPVDRARLLAALGHVAGLVALEASAERREGAALLGAGGDTHIVGSSPPVVRVFNLIRKFSEVDAPVLVTGETGTGKELIAHAVHRLSPWAEGPLVSFNCATCPRDLLDAELFGYEPGAFTGATRRRLGLARSAAGGSLFLDEVADLPPESQARLLRLLDPGEVRPLGADRSYPVETRIISATNADLDELARAGRFRDDLLYRLAQVRLHVPPLRKRRQDIPLLIEHFVAEVRQTSPQFRGIAPEAVERMKAHDWPGNVRQLRGEVFAVAALAGDGRVKSWRPPCEAPPPRPPVKAALPELTPEIMREALSRSGGSIRAAALRLDVSRGRLQRAIREAGIDPNEMRQPS